MSNNPAFAVDGLDRPIVIQHVRGVEGPSVYLNGLRIVGPKPWGGGSLVASWEITMRDILQGVLHERVGHPTRVDMTGIDTNDAMQYHTETRRRETPVLLAALSELASEIV